MFYQQSSQSPCKSHKSTAESAELSSSHSWGRSVYLSSSFSWLPSHFSLLSVLAFVDSQHASPTTGKGAGQLCRWVSCSRQNCTEPDRTVWHFLCSINQTPRVAALNKEKNILESWRVSCWQLEEGFGVVASSWRRRYKLLISRLEKCLLALVHWALCMTCSHYSPEGSGQTLLCYYRLAKRTNRST